MVFAARDSGVRTPMKEFPVPCDTSKYERTGFHVNTFAELSNERFRFYFIGEIKQRKNIQALLQAFHLEFRVAEPVDLVIKANFWTRNRTRLQGSFNGNCRSCQDGVEIISKPLRLQTRDCCYTISQRKLLIRFT